jgi:hypothetical protein
MARTLPHLRCGLCSGSRLLMRVKLTGDHIGGGTVRLLAPIKSREQRSGVHSGQDAPERIEQRGR